MDSDRLNALVQEACLHPPGSPQRQRALTQMIRQISRKLWRESSPYYEEALQDTYCFLCRRLCDLYDPTKASVTHWLNNHLKWRIHSLRQKEIQIQKRTVQRSPQLEEDFDLIANIPAPPEPEPTLVDLIREWAEEDADGSLRAKHLKNRPDVNCQMLILRRLPPESTWSELSKEFDAAIPAIAAIYQRHCVPRLRKFIEELEIDD